MNTLLHNHAEIIVKKAISAVLPDAAVRHDLQAVGELIFTSPTGTNVNDVAVILYRGK